jgi:hypothetical protein
MDIDKLLLTLPEDVRTLPAIQGLKVLVQTLVEQLNKAQEKIQSLEDEIKRLRKTPKRPKFRPNGMEPRDRGNKTDKTRSEPPSTSGPLVQKETVEIKLEALNVPKGSRFKGYQPYTVQDIVLVAKETTYKLAVWQTPDGKIIRATLPEGVREGGHFGPTLKALVTNLYADGLTQPALYSFLTGIGIDTSTGNVNDILLDQAEEFSEVSEAILKAGLEEAPFIRADDTGAKHQHKDSYCTHIGGEFFAYYKTTSSKSRANFLEILLQGKEKAYQINDAMVWHLSQCSVADDVLNLLEEYKGKIYASEKGLNRLLNTLGISGKKLRKQIHEAGLVGFLAGSILKPGQVFLSDRAGQFALFIHAACWIHMERPLRKLVCSSKIVEEELTRVRDAIWTAYRALKKASAEQQGKERVHELFDQIVAIKTSSPEINAVINNFNSYREELLMPLNYPGLPPHNNDSERDIRPIAKRRNLSGSTKSEEGRKFRDGLQSLKQTCFRLGYSFWEYLQRLYRGDPPDLADLVRNRYRAAHA